jgi:recombination protein RecT
MGQAVALQPSPVEEFVSNVLDPERMAEVSKSLPAHIKPAMFQRNLLNAVMANYDLMKFSPGLIFREVSKAVALGLFLDPQLGEAYIVPAYNYKTRATEPQLRIGYRGLTKLARQSGDVTIIYAHEVCANDKFVPKMGTDKSLVHEPDVFGDRGPVIGYYAVMKLRNGEVDFEPMSIAQVHRIRDRSDGWKAFSEGKIKSTPWSTDEDEMGKKTAIRRLMKRAPQSPELAEAIRIEDAAEHSEFSTARIVRIPPKPPTPPALAAPTQEAANIASAAPKEPEPAVVRSPPNPHAAKKPPAPAKPAPDADDLIAQFEAALHACKTPEEADTAYKRLIEPNQGALSDVEMDEADALLREHWAKFAPADVEP